jgi:hypothetical protein
MDTYVISAMSSVLPATLSEFPLFVLVSTIGLQQRFRFPLHFQFPGTFVRFLKKSYFYAVQLVTMFSHNESASNVVEIDSENHVVVEYRTNRNESCM